MDPLAARVRCLLLAESLLKYAGAPYTQEQLLDTADVFWSWTIQDDQSQDVEPEVEFRQ